MQYALVTDIKVSLSLKKSIKCRMIKRPMLVDEKDNAKETKSEGTRALKRRRRQEAPLVNIESSKGIHSVKLLEV